MLMKLAKKNFIFVLSCYPFFFCGGHLEPHVQIIHLDNPLGNTQVFVGLFNWMTGTLNGMCLFDLGSSGRLSILVDEDS